MKGSKMNLCCLALQIVSLASAFSPPIAPLPYHRYGALSVRRHTRAIDTSVVEINFGPRKIPEEIQAMVETLEAVKSLPRILDDQKMEDYNGLAVVCPESKPTFRRLFTHDTWKKHIGGSTLRRWLRCMSTTPSSVILRAVSKTVLFLATWTAVVSHFIPKFATMQSLKDQSLPLSLCGNAIGLLLVFRTNQAYNRLEEARDLMEKVIHLSGETVSTLVTSWQPYKEVSSNERANGSSDDSKEKKSVRTSTVASVCRHLAAFAWSLRDELRDGETRDDVLRLLLTPEEASWVSSQRSRTLAIHGHLRRMLYNECSEGYLDSNSHFLIEANLKQLSGVATSCERLFTSPIPPTMSRHGLRSMTLWMFALPVVLSVSAISPIVNVAWTSAIAFVYLGIDELGVQVEQPFRVIPMWQLCQLVQEDILEFALQPLELPQ